MLARAIKTGSALACGNGPIAKGSSASDRPATHALALPLISGDVQGRITPEFNRNWAKVALLWMGEGEIEGSAKGGLTQIVQRAIGQWIARQCEGLDSLRDSFAVGVALDPALLDWAYDGSCYLVDVEFDPDEQWALGLDVSSGENPFFTLSEKTTAIENEVPGLGRTALHWLYLAGWRTTSVFTPWTARQICEHLYWCGSSNQKEWLEEVAAQGMEESEIDGCLSPDWFDGHFPDWVIKPGKLLRRDVLAPLSADASLTPQARAVAALLVEIGDLYESGAELPMHQIGVEPVCFGAYLRWSKDDPLLRVLDDHEQMANECSEGYTTFSGVDFISLEDVDAFRKWKMEKEAGFSLLRKLDRLIGLVATPSE